MLLRVVIFWGPYDQHSSHGPQKFNGTVGLNQDKESVDRKKPGNVLPFCHSVTRVHVYCCRDQAAPKLSTNDE